MSENHDAELYAVSIIFTVLAAVAVGLRIAATRIKARRLEIDDYLVLLAFV